MAQHSLWPDSTLWTQARGQGANLRCWPIASRKCSVAFIGGADISAPGSDVGIRRDKPMRIDQGALNADAASPAHSWTADGSVHPGCSDLAYVLNCVTMSQCVGQRWAAAASGAQQYAQ